MDILKTLTINGSKFNVVPVVPSSSVTLLASAWVGGDDAYSQVVELAGVTANTKVDLQPTAEQLQEFHHKVLGFVAENEAGVITVYSIGDKPTRDHTIQVTLTEVEGTGKIRGNTVGTTMPRANLAQTDPTKADYVRGKEVYENRLLALENGEFCATNSIASTVLNDDYTLTITFTDGTSYTTPSIRGAIGKKGDDGVGIASIRQTTTSMTDGGNNIFTVTLTDGTSANFAVQNGSKGSSPVRGVDYWTPDDKSEVVNELADVIQYVTPQMYGAKADGVTDDTAAVQAALNAGGTVYFPTGRYKVTAPLEATVPCIIKMAGAYPSSYSESLYEGYTYPMADYPTNNTYNHFGARLETYATGVGLLIGESVVVDGLNIRAMEGFSGTVLKYDASKGVRSYPSNTRLEHIKISNENANVKPEVMFDFFPYGNYGVIVNDVLIGSNHIRQYATYGFKCVLDKWVNSVRISNVNVEAFAKYPFYINGATPHEGQMLYAANWVLKSICLQAYPQKSWDAEEYVHQHMLYLEGMTGTYITGCKIWDVEAATVLSDVVKTVDLRNTTAIGNDDFVDAIDMLLTAKIVEAGELDLAGLEVSVRTSDDGTGNTVTMRDGHGNVKQFTVPAATLTDEQVGTAVGNWMIENGEPVEQVGKNKLKPDECWDGAINATWGHQQADDNNWVTGFIPCAYKDEVRAFETVTDIPGGNLKVYRQTDLSSVFEYDANQEYIGRVATFTNKIYTPSADNVAYCRVQFTGKAGNYPPMYEDRDKCMVTINTANSEFEPYKIEMVGGIGQYLKLKSPNGTNFTLSVNDDGTIVGVPVS